MFVVSRRTKYSLKALYHLSRAYGDRWVTISQIAKEEGIPQTSLANILVDLKNCGIVNSERGQHGGYRLSRPPARITVGSAVRAIEGPLTLLPCASEKTHQTCDECTDADACGTRFVMRRVMKVAARMLDEVTLADACDVLAPLRASDV